MFYRRFNICRVETEANVEPYVCQSSGLELAKAQTRWQKFWSQQFLGQSYQRAEAKCGRARR